MTLMTPLTPMSLTYHAGYYFNLSSLMYPKCLKLRNNSAKTMNMTAKINGQLLNLNHPLTNSVFHAKVTQIQSLIASRVQSCLKILLSLKPLPLENFPPFVLEEKSPGNL